MGVLSLSCFEITLHVFANGGERPDPDMGIFGMKRLNKHRLNKQRYFFRTLLYVTQKSPCMFFHLGKNNTFDAMHFIKLCTMFQHLI
jgi:hypothetical protein